jgi:hypothetical protein
MKVVVGLSEQEYNSATDDMVNALIIDVSSLQSHSAVTHGSDSGAIHI